MEWLTELTQAEKIEQFDALVNFINNPGKFPTEQLVDELNKRHQEITAVNLIRLFSGVTARLLDASERNQNRKSKSPIQHLSLYPIHMDDDETRTKMVTVKTEFLTADVVFREKWLVEFESKILTDFLHSKKGPLDYEAMHEAYERQPPEDASPEIRIFMKVLSQLHYVLNNYGDNESDTVNILLVEAAEAASDEDTYIIAD